MSSKKGLRKNTKPMIHVIDKNGNAQEIPDCRKSKERYIEQANEIWRGKYDYTNSDYKGNKEPITIFCPRHNYHFRVAMAQNHIMRPKGTFRPTGCPICTYEQQHGEEYGPDWREFLEPCEKQNRVRKIYKKPTHKVKSEEQLEKEHIEHERKQQEREAYIVKWHANNYNEAIFLERLHQMYGERYGTHLVNYQGREVKVTLVCPDHGEFRITPRILLNGRKNGKPHGCWECCGLPNPDKKLEPIERGDIINIVKDYEKKMHHRYWVSAIDMRNKTIVVKCPIHGETKHSFSWWHSGKGCEYCDGTKFWRGDFLKLAREKHGRKYHYRGLKNIQNKASIIQIHCDNPEHHWWSQRVDRHLYGDGCRECAGRHLPQNQRCQNWIDKSVEKYRGQYDYGRVLKDYKNNDSKVWIGCKVCGTWFQITPDTHLRGVNGGCPTCYADLQESEGERSVRLWLENHNINYNRDHNIPNEDPTLPLQYLIPDFYIETPESQADVIIEYNGEQHYSDIPHFYEDRRRDFSVQQHRDRYLRRYCENRHIILLEIPYTQYDSINDILDAFFTQLSIV